MEGARVGVGRFGTLLWRRDERAFLTRFEQCRGLDRGRGRLQKPMVRQHCGYVRGENCWKERYLEDVGLDACRCT